MNSLNYSKAPVADSLLNSPPLTARIQRFQFGALTDGQKIEAFTLSNSRGLACQIMSYGACITQLHVPDRKGKLADIVLGYSDLEGYLLSNSYAGATIGRVANRIASARFMLDGCACQLAANDGQNHLHGGLRGFDKVEWVVEPGHQEAYSPLTLSYISQDEEEGYPGRLTTKVSYTLSDQNELRIDYAATTDKPTPVSLTNHTYFNLVGYGDILNHILTVNADHYMPLNLSHVPTGAIRSVAGTSADFRVPARIGSHLSDRSNGFNHSYVLNGAAQPLAFAARLCEPTTGRVLEMWTNQPGLQFYSGQYLHSIPRGKHGESYGLNSGLCLEPQHFPDAVNQPHFPSVILFPGQIYRHTTIWKFSILP